MKRSLLVCLILVTALLSVVSLAWFGWGGLAGVRLDFHLSAVPQGRPVHSVSRPRLDFSFGQVMDPHPRGGGFCLAGRGVLHPPGPGRVRLAVVSLGRTSLSIAGRNKDFPPLSAWPAPAGLTARGRPGGNAGAALDRDLASRFTSGAAKRGGEELIFDFARPVSLLGLVLDSAAAGFRDAPVGFKVEAFAPGRGWRLLARGEVPRHFASTVDAFFPPATGSRFKVRQTGRDERYWWSVNEAHPITTGDLDARALSLELAGPAPFRLHYRPPAEEEAPGSGRVRRDYSLLRLYWKTSGGPWRIVPARALALRPAGLWAPALAGLAAATPWLPWAWALLLAGWLWALLARRRPAAPEPAEGPGLAWLAPLSALAWGLLGVLGLPGGNHFFENFLVGPGVLPAWADRLPWLSWGGVIFLAGVAAFSWPRAASLLRRAGWPAGAAGLFFAGAACLILFAQALGLSQPLTSDDHGIFLYGHQQWDHLSPASTIYNLFWNAGALEWEPVRNGSAGLYLLSRPLTWFLPLARAYTLATPLVFALVIPGLGFAALRGAGAAPGAALLGAAFMLLPLPQWIYWIKEGSNGGIVAAGLSLPLLIWFLKFLESERFRPALAAASALVFSLALFWLPFAFAAALPCLAALLIYLPGMNGRRRVRALLFLGGVAILNALWLYPFAANFPLFSFGGNATGSLWPALNLAWSVERLWFLLREINPLLLVCGLWGLAWLPPRRRLVLAVFLLNAAVLAVVLERAAPTLQLWRMWQFVAVGLVWPAGLCLQRLMARARGWRGALAAGTLACFLAGGLAAPGLFYAQKLARRDSSPAPPVLTALARWLGRAGAPPGRVLLAGHTEMQYHGCAGWLQMFSGKAMIADFYVKYLDRKLEVNLPGELCLSPPPPARYRELLRLYDVGQVVVDAADRANPWPVYLDRRAFLRRELDLDERFRVYRVLDPGGGRFLQGEGEAREAWGALTVIPHGPGDLVLKYHWLPNLKAEGAKLAPFAAGVAPPFIKASGHGGKPFVIRLGAGLF